MSPLRKAAIAYYEKQVGSDLYAFQDLNTEAQNTRMQCIAAAIEAFAEALPDGIDATKAKRFIAAALKGGE